MRQENELVKQNRKTIVLGRLLRKVLESNGVIGDPDTKIGDPETIIEQFERQFSSAHWLVNEDGFIWTLTFRPGWPNEYPEGIS